jgi:hypothetical protein
LHLLAGVLETEEEDLRHRLLGSLQSCEQIELDLFGDVSLDGPIVGEIPDLIEIGRDEMHHLVQRRGEGDLVGSDGGIPVVGGLEDPRIADDLIW